MRVLDRMNSTKMAALTAAVVIAASLATVTTSFGQSGAAPVLLGDVGCYDPGDRVERQTIRALCDEYAEGFGFASGILRPAGADPLNGTQTCPPPEQLWECYGVGAAAGSNSAP